MKFLSKKITNTEESKTSGKELEQSPAEDRTNATIVRFKHPLPPILKHSKGTLKSKTKEEELESKRAGNRASAARCRQKDIDRKNTLTRQVEALEKGIAEVRALNDKLKARQW